MDFSIFFKSRRISRPSDFSLFETTDEESDDDDEGYLAFLVLLPVEDDALRFLSLE
jgi:hypothetical protein